MELQKRLPNYYLVTTLQRLPVSGQKPAAAIYEGAICRSEVFYKELPILIHDSRMAARDLGFGIILIKVYIREYSAICIPSSDVGFCASHRKFLSNSSSPFYDQLAVHVFFALLRLLFIRPKRISPASGGQNEGLSGAQRFTRNTAWWRPAHSLGLTLITERPGGLGHACRSCK